MPIFTFARTNPMVRTNSAHIMFLPGKHMLHPHSDPKLAPIGPRQMRRHLPPFRFKMMNARDKAALSQHYLVLSRMVSRIHPYIGRRVLSVQQLLQPRSVMPGNIHHRPLADQIVTAVDTEATLAIINCNKQSLLPAILLLIRLAVLHCPIRIFFPCISQSLLQHTSMGRRVAFDPPRLQVPKLSQCLMTICMVLSFGATGENIIHGPLIHDGNAAQVE